MTTFYNGKVVDRVTRSVPLTSEAQIQLDVGAPIVAPEHIKFPKALGASMKTSK